MGLAASSVQPISADFAIRPVSSGYGYEVFGSTSGFNGIRPRAIEGSIRWYLPSADGAANLPIVTDGAAGMAVGTAANIRTALGIDSNDSVVFGDLTVNDLVVNGTSTTLSSTVTVHDPLIKLADDNVADSLDVGFYAKYVSGGTKYAGLFRDVSALDRRFRLFNGLQVEPTTTVDIGGAGYTTGTLEAKILSPSINLYDSVLFNTTITLDGETGDAIFLGALQAPTFNGVAITNLGSAFQYLGQDGNYTIPFTMTSAGTGTELQCRVSASALGAISGSSWDGTYLGLLGPKISIGNPLATVPFGTIHISMPNNTFPIIIEASDHNTSPGIAVYQYLTNNNALNGGNYTFFRANGTIDVPLVNAANDALGTVRWRSYLGAAIYGRAAEVSALSDGVSAAGSSPGKIVIRTTPSGSTTPIDRVTIDKDGLITTSGSINGVTLSATGAANEYLRKNGVYGAVPYADLTGTPSTFSPSAHASSHMNAGADAVRLDELKAPTDTTDLDVSITLHGLVPKAPNDVTKFLNGLGAWSVPAHGSLSGLTATDHHTQYALLTGRAGGQTFIGGTGSGDDLTLISTSHGTVGDIFFGTAGALARITSTGKFTANGTYQALTADADGVTITFDMNVSNFHKVTLGDNRILAVSNVTTGQAFSLRLTQDGTGTRTVTWFAGISWAGGVAPTLTTAINKTDTFGFLCTGSNTYDGFVLGQNI